MHFFFLHSQAAGIDFVPLLPLFAISIFMGRNGDVILRQSWQLQ